MERRFRRGPEFENSRLTAALWCQLSEQCGYVQQTRAGGATGDVEPHQMRNPLNVKILHVQIHSPGCQLANHRLQSFAGSQGIRGIEADADPITGHRGEDLPQDCCGETIMVLDSQSEAVELRQCPAEKGRDVFRCGVVPGVINDEADQSGADAAGDAGVARDILQGQAAGSYFQSDSLPPGARCQKVQSIFRKGVQRQVVTDLEQAHPMLTASVEQSHLIEGRGRVR